MSSLKPRRSSISSRCPALVIRPVTAPLISIIVLSAVVVPCTIAPVRASSLPVSSPSCSASHRMPFRTPTDWSCGVVALLPSRIDPSAAGQDEIGEGAANVDADAIHRTAGC